jgi:hypothetical protein
VSKTIKHNSKFLAGPGSDQSINFFLVEAIDLRHVPGKNISECIRIGYYNIYGINEYVCLTTMKVQRWKGRSTDYQVAIVKISRCLYQILNDLGTSLSQT